MKKYKFRKKKEAAKVIKKPEPKTITIDKGEICTVEGFYDKTTGELAKFIVEKPLILTEEQREKIVSEMESQLKSMPMLIETPRGR